MKTLSLILLVFIIPLTLVAQTTSLISENNGPASDADTWQDRTTDVPCWKLNGHNLIINNIVNTDCNYWGNTKTYVDISSGGELIYEENVTLNGNEASASNTIRSLGKIHVLKNLTLTGPLVIEDGGILEVDGDLTLSDNSTIIGGDDVAISVGGELNIQGTVRDAITLGENSVLTVTGRTDIRNAKIILDGSTFTAESDVKVGGDSQTGIILTRSTFNVAGSYTSPNGTLSVDDGSNVNISGNMNLSGASRNAVEILSSSNLTVDGLVNISNSAAMLVAGGTVTTGNDMNISGSGYLEITKGGNPLVDGIFTVNGDVNLYTGVHLDITQGNLIIQSIDNEDGSYSGGNLNIYNGFVEVFNGGQITILGNKNFGVEVGAPNVEGNLFITPNVGKLLVDPFGKVLIYNNVESRPEQFYTNWINPGGTPPVFVIMGGTSCANWGGPLGTCNMGDGTLPIELMSFTAEAGDAGVVLEWETAAELNNDYFTIERSYDGMEFNKVGTVLGNGTTDSPETYTFTDMKAIPGTIYYRLKQTDFDGMSETFDPVSVNYLPVGDNVTIYPNPIDHGLLKMGLAGFSSDRSADIRITDLAGRTVIMETIDISNATYTVVEMDVASKLDRGAYIINISQGSNAFTKRLVKM